MSIREKGRAVPQSKNRKFNQEAAIRQEEKHLAHTPSEEVYIPKDADTARRQIMQVIPEEYLPEYQERLVTEMCNGNENEVNRLLGEINSKQMFKETEARAKKAGAEIVQPEIVVSSVRSEYVPVFREQKQDFTSLIKQVEAEVGERYADRAHELASMIACGQEADARAIIKELQSEQLNEVKATLESIDLDLSTTTEITQENTMEQVTTNATVVIAAEEVKLDEVIGTVTETPEEPVVVKTAEELHEELQTKFKEFRERLAPANEHADAIKHLNVGFNWFDRALCMAF